MGLTASSVDVKHLKLSCKGDDTAVRGIGVGRARMDAGGTGVRFTGLGSTSFLCPFRFGRGCSFIALQGSEQHLATLMDLTAA